MARWIFVHDGGSCSITTAVDNPKTIFDRLRKYQPIRITLTHFPIDVRVFTKIECIRCDYIGDDPNGLHHIFFHIGNEQFSIYIEGPNPLMSLISVIHAYSEARFHEVVPQHCALRKNMLIGVDVVEAYGDYDYYYLLDGESLRMPDSCVVTFYLSRPIKFDASVDHIRNVRRYLVNSFYNHIHIPREIWDHIGSYII
jgi:hypothetical protein